LDSTCPCAASHVAAFPPCAALTVIACRREVVPAHGFEQFVHGPHAPTQSTAHGRTLHGLVSSPSGHSAVGQWARGALASGFVYVRASTPSPQAAEQPDHALQPSAHATHGSALHARVSSASCAAAQAPPRLAGGVTEKVRVWLPPPHSAEHAVNSPHAPTQSTAAHVAGGSTQL
jgi:hypothetical protein